MTDWKMMPIATVTLDYGFLGGGGVGAGNEQLGTLVFKVTPGTDDSYQISDAYVVEGTAGQGACLTVDGEDVLALRDLLDSHGKIRRHLVLLGEMNVVRDLRDRMLTANHALHPLVEARWDWVVPGANEMGAQTYGLFTIDQVLGHFNSVRRVGGVLSGIAERTEQKTGEAEGYAGLQEIDVFRATEYQAIQQHYSRNAGSGSLHCLWFFLHQPGRISAPTYAGSSLTMTQTYYTRELTGAARKIPANHPAGHMTKERTPGQPSPMMLMGFDYMSLYTTNQAVTLAEVKNASSGPRVELAMAHSDPAAGTRVMLMFDLVERVLGVVHKDQQYPYRLQPEPVRLMEQLKKSVEATLNHSNLTHGMETLPVAYEKWVDIVKEGERWLYAIFYRYLTEPHRDGETPLWTKMVDCHNKTAAWNLLIREMGLDAMVVTQKSGPPSVQLSGSVVEKIKAGLEDNALPEPEVGPNTRPTSLSRQWANDGESSDGSDKRGKHNRNRKRTKNPTRPDKKETADRIAKVKARLEPLTKLPDWNWWKQKEFFGLKGTREQKGGAYEAGSPLFRPKKSSGYTVFGDQVVKQLPAAKQEALMKAMEEFHKK